jgi:hypothetical protein
MVAVVLQIRIGSLAVNEICEVESAGVTSSTLGAFACGRLNLAAPLLKLLKATHALTQRRILLIAHPPQPSEISKLLAFIGRDDRVPCE